MTLDEQIQQDLIEDAWREGYSAGVEFHLGSGHRAENPHEYDSGRHVAWENGFAQAGEDS